MQKKLKAATAHLRWSFHSPSKKAPVSGMRGMMNTRPFRRDGHRPGDDFVLTVIVGVTRFAPCSKAISDYGRIISVETSRCRSAPSGPSGLRTLIAAGGEFASFELYSLLKRQDEKAVTERAVRKPRFSVEDLVRNVALKLHAPPK